MSLRVYQGTGGSATRKDLLDPKVYVGSGGSAVRTDVQEIYAYDAGVRTLVWARTSVGLTAAPLAWDRVKVDWTPPGPGADSYVLKRNGTQIYAGTALTFTDTLLNPATSYTYLLTAIRAGSDAGSSTVVATTPARADMGLATGTVTWSSVPLTWTDTSGGSIDSYAILRGGVQVYSGAVATKAFTDTGLSGGTTYAYTLQAKRSGAVISTDTVSATTSSRPAMSMTTSAVAWDRATLTWTDTAGDADQYILKRGSTQVYSGTAKTFTDTLLNQSTSYTWTLEARKSGGLLGTTTATTTTPAYADLGLTASAAAWNQVNLSWAAKNGSIDEFILKRGTTTIYTGTGTSKSDTGLAASTGYSYTLYARRSAVEIKTDTASATTPARPTSSGSVYGPGAGSGYYWTQSTAKTLTSTNVSMPVSGYVSAFNLLISGYGATGICNPHMDGTYFGERTIGSTTAGSPGWTDISGGNRSLGAGAHSIGCNTGGNSSYKSQWKPYSGGSSTTVTWGQVNYWYYSALERFEELRVHPWWRHDFEDVPETHIETWVDESGQTIRARITDKQTGDLLGEWEA